jgi:hypothetical protein
MKIKIHALPSDGCVGLLPLCSLLLLLVWPLVWFNLSVTLPLCLKNLPPPSQHLGFLAGGASAGAGSGDLASALQGQFKGGKSNDEVSDWIAANAAPAVNTPALTRALVSALAASFSLDASGKLKDVSPAAQTAEIEARANLLIKYADNDTLKLHLLCTLQKFWYQHSTPQGWLSAWFLDLYNASVVDEDSLKKWRDDTTVKADEYPGKGAAVHEVRGVFEQLESADKDTDPEDK